ncbi:Hypothetical predicted protein [Paramuricea clavata]|uniref:Uncharacterized protein n=1 Tax=Paramuricea clavata TaxID=317549 RepID=A0A6S7FJS1_PARCT|nr:Hypothetical predicted protein [Paramuricea clavata]
MAPTKVRRNFCWTTEMVENLIDFLSVYKSSMEYKSLDFDADKSAQYKHLRQEMAKLYADEDKVLFGPVREVLPIENIDELSNEEKAEVKTKQVHQRELISKGYNRIVEKIWGGSANTEPLSFGVSSERLNSEGDGHQDLQNNKHKHLEKNLSAAERDKILINESKEEKEARQNFTAVMKKSNQCFMKAMECMSKSMQDVGAGISWSMEMLAHVASGNNLHPQFPVNQNIFNQGIQPNYPASVPARVASLYGTKSLFALFLFFSNPR